MNIDLSEYDFYEILCYGTAVISSKTLLTTGVIPIPFNAYCGYDAIYRTFTYSNEKIVVGSGYNGATLNNDCIIPYQVIGYKSIV